jgi:ubiquinone/menaquinone biosynthesis C-methylase UbiE
MQTLGLQPDTAPTNKAAVEAQRIQQEHFDWYAGNDTQTYSAYEQMPFWREVDAKTFAAWRKELQPGKWLLDVGCAQGRSTFKLLDLPLQVVGFDISKACIRQAITQYRQGKYQAEATFFVGDGSALPFTPQSFDYALIYGVLHHLPDASKTCRDLAEILKPGGVYFGCENNQTIFRKLFDWMMKIIPIWHEEAGAQPLISASDFRCWFEGTPIHVQTTTQVFVPPHLVNLLGCKVGGSVMHMTDWLYGHLPVLKHQGGLIMIRGESKATATVSPPATARKAA